MRIYFPPWLPVPQHQPVAELNQANPVQNQWYTILDTTLMCRIYDIATYVDTTGETLQLRITIDGLVLTGLVTACTAGTTNFGYFDWAGNPCLTTTTYYIYRAFLIEGRSIKVEVRKTTATGSGNLHGSVVYGKWP